MRNFTNLSFFIASLFITLTGVSQQVSSKVVFEQGQILTVLSDMKSVISQEAMGQSIEFKVDGQVNHDFTVTNATESNTTLRHATKRMHFNFDGMGAKRSFDSDKKKDLDGEMGGPIKDLLSKTYDVILDPTGKVLMVAPETFTATAGDDRLAIITNMLKDLMGAVQPPIKGSMGFFQVLPGQDVKVGSSWTSTIDKPEEKNTTTYTLASVSDSLITVNVTGKSSTTSKAEMMGMETLTKMNTTSTGTILLDKVTGIIREQTIVNESTGTTEVMGNAMPVSAKTTIKTVVTKQ